MEIKGYKVTWKVGERGNLINEEKSFLGSNPIEQRRNAINFAKTISHVIYEGINEGVLPFKTSMALSEMEKESVFPYVSACVVEDDGGVNELIIYGELIEIMIDEWDEELECYLENEYDTGDDIYPLDASGFNRGNIRVLKGDFDMYHDVFEAKMNEKEY
jgi:hypothetical protein